MAELGSIEYQETSGVPAGDSSAGARTIAGAVAQVGDAIARTKINDVLGDFRDEANAVALEHRENATTATVFEGASTLEGEPGRIHRRVRGLAAQMEKGNSSQRSLAELEMKKLLNEAQEAYPGLARELQQQYGMVVSGNHKLDEIAMIDALNESNSKTAQAEYKQMVDHARAAVEDGGLGIDPTLPPNSAEFAKQYAERQQIKNLEQAHAMDLQFAVTTADMSARDKNKAASKAIRGKGNLITSTMNQYMDMIVAYRGQIALPNDQRDLQAMENFSSNVRPAMTEQLNFLKAELLDIPRQMYATTEERSSDGYAQLQLMVNDEIARIDTILEAVKGDDMAAMDHAIAANRIRAFEMRGQNSSYDSFLTMFNPEAEGFQGLLETFAKLDLTGQAQITGQQVANTGFLALNEMLRVSSTPELMTEVFHSAGQGQVYDAQSPAGIHATLRANWSGNEGFYGDANSTEEEDLARSVAHLEMMRRASASAVATKSPSTAGLFMTDATNAFLVMDAIGNPAGDQIQATTSILSDPTVIEAAMLEGNGLNKSRRMALGQAAQDFYANTQPAEQMRSMQMALEQPYMGARIRDFFTIGPADDEVTGSTQLEARINSVFLKDQIQASLGTELFDASLKQYESQLNQRIQPIMNKVNEHIRANAHVEALLAPTLDKDTVDYIHMADQLGWLDYLLEQ